MRLCKNLAEEYQSKNPSASDPQQYKQFMEHHLKEFISREQKKEQIVMSQTKNLTKTTKADFQESLLESIKKN